MHFIQDNKMSEKNDIAESVFKVGGLLFYILIGLCGTFGLDILNGKRITTWYAVGTTLCAFFVGIISWNICPRVGIDRQVGVPLITLCSKDVLLFVKSIDFTKIGNALLKSWLKNALDFLNKSKK